MSTIDFMRVRQFLVRDALPFWSTHGAYPNGCFVEQLDLAGAPADPGFTRVRVQARQLYVFSHAHLSGLFACADLVHRSAEFLMRAAWLGPDRGWARRLRRDGTLLDAGFDFYDVAFALFALGWYYRVSGDPRCLARAHETLDFLEMHARHPSGGFINDAANSLPRQQNPHMHLVEALNVWFEATGEERFAALSHQMLDLFETRFTDCRTGALFEFFDADWTRCAAPAGDIVEPGHQFEWAWIIAHNGRMTGKPRLELMRRVIASALRSGFDSTTGLTVDQVDDAGRLLAGSHRLWPQTEAIKAALAEREFLGTLTAPRIARIVSVLFKRFLDPGPVPGTWIDHYDPEWRPVVDKVPASSLYHLTVAFLDLLRLQQLLST